MSESDAMRSAEENLLGSSQMGHAMEEAIEHKLARYCLTEGGQDNDDRFLCEQTEGDIDTGLLADFMSLNLAEQLQVKRAWLEKPLPIQLAMQGSRSKVNFGVNVHFQYQGTDYQ